MGCLLEALLMRQRAPFALTCRYWAYHVSMPSRVLPGKAADIFAARTERDGARRRIVEAELFSGFAEVQFRKGLSFTLGVLFAPEDAEIGIRHLVGSLARLKAATDGQLKRMGPQRGEARLLLTACRGRNRPSRARFATLLTSRTFSEPQFGARVFEICAW